MTANKPADDHGEPPLDARKVAAQLPVPTRDLPGASSTARWQFITEVMTLSRRLTTSSLVRGSFLVFTIQGLATVVRYVAQVLFARVGGSEAYGVFSFAFSWSQLLVAPAALGFTFSVLRFAPAYLHADDTPKLLGLVRRSTQFVLVGACGAAGLGTMFAWLLVAPGPKLGALLVGLWTLPALVLINLQRELIRGAQRLLFAYGTAELLPALVTLGATAALVVFATVTPIGMLLLMFVGFLVALLVQRFFMNWALRISKRPVRREYETSHWLLTSLPLGVNVIALNFLAGSDILFLGSLRSASETGVYSAASRTAALIAFVLTAVSGVIAPIIGSHYAAGQMRELEQVLRRVVVGTTAVSLLVATVVMVLAAPILATFGPGFREGVVALRILAGAQLIGAATGPVGFVLALAGHQKKMALISAVTAGIAAIGYTLVIPSFGSTGAAVVMALAISAGNVWTYAIVRRKFGFRLYWLV